MSAGSIRLAELLEGVADASASAELTVSGLALDTRQLRAGDVFVALAGGQGHGLDHLGSAIANGAVAVLHDGQGPLPSDCPLPLIRVEGLKGRLIELARRVWQDPAAALDLVAVTGTNGKSSVAWLLAQALDGAMIGTLGIGRPGSHRAAALTTPDVLSLHRALAELRDAGLTLVVMEASSHALDQQRLAGLSFSSVIFTTLGHDHLDYHGDLAAYGAAKARLFFDYDSVRQLINVDDAFGAELAARLDGSPGLIRLSLDSEGATVSARIRRADSEGLSLAVRLRGGELELESALIGRVNAWNLLIVAAELEARGVDLAEIKARIAALKPVPGRMQALGQGPRVVIDYAHTPDALANALASLRELGPERLWCVFGCGGDRDRAKRPRMGQIAEALADRVVLTDDNPRSEDSLAIIRAIQAGMREPTRCQVVPDRAAAIQRAVAEAGRVDIVLVAGKGHETEQLIGNQRLPFSDELTSRQALEAACSISA